MRWLGPESLVFGERANGKVVHISEVERAGIGHPQEGQKLEYELQRGQQGQSSAGNLKLA